MKGTSDGFRIFITLVKLLNFHCGGWGWELVQNTHTLYIFHMVITWILELIVILVWMTELKLNRLEPISREYTYI